MVAKCGGITHIALMEVAQVGVRTRARAALAAIAANKNSTGETAVKRRKITRTELESSSYSLVQFSSQQSTVTNVENKVLQADAEHEDRCSSPISNQFLESCCSSNRSSELEEERRNPVDLVEVEVESAEVETSTCNYTRQRKKMSNSSKLQTKIDELESTVEPLPETNSHRIPIVKCRPTELELEKFFVAAEKDVQLKFADKYNFDIVNDVPLEGRYEWVLLERKGKLLRKEECSIGDSNQCHIEIV